MSFWYLLIILDGFLNIPALFPNISQFFLELRLWSLFCLFLIILANFNRISPDIFSKADHVSSSIFLNIYLVVILIEDARRPRKFFFAVFFVPATFWRGLFFWQRAKWYKGSNDRRFQPNWQSWNPCKVRVDPRRKQCNWYGTFSPFFEIFSCKILWWKCWWWPSFLARNCEFLLR